MPEPEGAQHGVVAALVQVQLAAVAEAHVDLAVPVDIRRVTKRAGRPVQVQDAAPTDVDIQSDVLLASARGTRVSNLCVHHIRSSAFAS